MTCLTVLALAGCGGKDTPVDWIALTEAAPALPPQLPAECLAGDRQWVNLPDRDVTQSEGARNLQANKTRYSELLSNRAICRAALKAMQSTTVPQSSAAGS